MNLFKLTEESKVNEFGKTLYRIEAIGHFNDIETGDKGGWVESSANISGRGWVAGDAEVMDNAIVSDRAIVSGNAKIYENAIISQKAKISGNAQVYGNVNICGVAKIYENALIYGDVIINERAKVHGNGTVYGSGRISGRSEIKNGKWNNGIYQKQGSKHFVNISDPSSLKIGCIETTFDDWYENYEKIGMNDGFTPEEILEYKEYIDQAATSVNYDSSVN